ncbi:MAG: amidophosphoribosyltransferase, partial [Melioribacteraceae bacterium]|nr:amidophosphoribosyltransferase [Melioribacteraceae bacterium]
MRVFDEAKLKTLSGSSAIGHTRYSTAGDDSILDAQPVFARYDLGEMAIVHNGNLTNAEEVRNNLIAKGAIFQTFMDTENLIHLIAK